MTNAGVRDAVALRLEHSLREPLRLHIRTRIVQRTRRACGSHVDEPGVEIGKIDAHFESRLETADLAELRCPMVDRLGQCGLNAAGGVPCAALSGRKTSAAVTWMAERCHDHAGHGTAGPRLF